MDNNPITSIREELIAAADQKTKDGFLRIFKEKIKFHGVKMALIDKVGKENFQKVKTLTKKQIFGLIEQLWQSGYCEESWIAGQWTYRLKKDYEPDDFKTFACWVNRYVNNWASCDNFCNHAMGTFIEKYPEYISELKKWTGSTNRWVKRAAAVTLILPARHGKFLNDIFVIADKLLSDTDDMVQKGYGWMLKEAGKIHQKEVFDYVMKHKAFMPRTALRYAIEKMPPDLKKQAMAR